MKQNGEGGCVIREHELQNRIREALGKQCVIFRINVGKFKTADGRYIDTGVPVGFSDLFGYRRGDGKAVFIEVKRPAGANGEPPQGEPSKAQKHFLETMQKNGAIAGIARSVEDALKLIEEE